MLLQAVLKFKTETLQAIFKQKQARDTLASTEFKEWLKHNEHWLAPYALFCVFRDQYETRYIVSKCIRANLLQ